MTSSEHNLHSSYREALLEHLFAGEVMRYLWLGGIHRIEVLRPQVDDGGYDLVLEANGVTRHVQLKSSHRGSSTAQVNVNLRLCEKPSGCIVWMQFDPETLKLGPFYWFGGEPNQQLPDVTGFHTARHTKGNAEGVKAERPNVKVVPRARFRRIDDLATLVHALFGIDFSAERAM